jgi:hypothetical protein
MDRRNFLLACAATAPLWPEALRAQLAGQSPRLGGLLHGNPQTNPDIESFELGFRELGYDDRKNVTIEYRYADGNPERLPELAALKGCWDKGQWTDGSCCPDSRYWLRNDLQWRRPRDVLSWLLFGRQPGQLHLLMLINSRQVYANVAGWRAKQLRFLTVSPTANRTFSLKLQQKLYLLHRMGSSLRLHYLSAIAAEVMSKYVELIHLS